MLLEQEENECVPDSSMINKVEYAPSSKTLYVIFNNNSVYGFEEIPPELFDGLCQAPSAGQFFNKQIKDRFSYTRLQ